MDGFTQSAPPLPGGAAARRSTPAGGSGTAELVEVQTTNLLKFAELQAPFPLALPVTPGRMPRPRCRCRSCRCGATRTPCMEDKRGTVFNVGVEVDGAAGVVEIAASEEMRGEILRWVADWCGFGPGVTDAEPVAHDHLRPRPRLERMSSVAPHDPAAARGISRRTQSEIYRAGISGTKPAVPVDPDALEAAARKALSAEAFAYIAGGAGAERTVAANRAAFDALAGVAAAAARCLGARPVDRASSAGVARRRSCSPRSG